MTVATPASSIGELQENRKTTITTKVADVRKIAEGIYSYELVADRLPAFTAGSHIDVYLPNGLIRQYSLCNDPAERHRYVIAVQREEHGRGGSAYMHENLHVGCMLDISAPRNHFPLEESARRFKFIAGGIGITPLVAMIKTCLRNHADFHLHYCVRSRSRAAFMETLLPLAAKGRVSLYFDDEGGRPDWAEILKHPGEGEHVYYCGPSGFLDIVGAASAHWPAGHVHFERFSAGSPSSTEAPGEADEPFDVRLAQSGETYTVGADETIVEVLERNGVHVDVSCEEGYCGTCMTRYVGGVPEHRDSVLDDANRKNYVMVCCARAKQGPLVLDI